MGFTPFKLTNKPKFAATDKTMAFSFNRSEGNLRITLTNGYSEYNPQEIQTIIDALQNVLNELEPWDCKHCNHRNWFVNAPLHFANGAYNGVFGYKWMRCQNCKRKTKMEELGLSA